MDSKITRRRVSDLLQYDWLKIIGAILVIIALWEILFSVTAVKITSEQTFRYFYDVGVYPTSSENFYRMVASDKSYDTLSVESGDTQASASVMVARLDMHDVDIIISQKLQDATNKDADIRAKTLIDDTFTFHIGSFEKLLSDAQSYLRLFLKDGATDQDIYDFDKMSIEKINANFLYRMQGDNRFRTDSQKAIGMIAEQNRIKDLCEQVEDFEKLLGKENQGLFFEYTRFEQIKDNDSLSESERAQYEKLYNENEKLKYGLNVGALKGGRNPSEFFTAGTTGNAQDIVIMYCDFVAYQPNMHFECIRFINLIVRECTAPGFLDN